MMTHRSKKVEKTKVPEDNVAILEEWIDEMDAKLPPFKTFTIPVSAPHWVDRRPQPRVAPLSRCAAPYDVVRSVPSCLSWKRTRWTLLCSAT